MIYDEEFKRQACRVAEFALEKKRAWQMYADTKNKEMRDHQDHRSELAAAMAEISLWEERFSSAVEALSEYVTLQKAG